MPKGGSGNGGSRWVDAAPTLLAKRSGSGRTCGVPGIPDQPVGDPHAHRGQHPVHSGADVIDGDRFDAVLAQEPRDARVVRALASALLR